MREPETCLCGHLESEHQSNRARSAGTLRFGVCRVDGCACQSYRRSPEHGELMTPSELVERVLYALLSDAGVRPRPDAVIAARRDILALLADANAR